MWIEDINGNYVNLQRCDVLTVRRFNNKSFMWYVVAKRFGVDGKLVSEVVLKHGFRAFEDAKQHLQSLIKRLSAQSEVAMGILQIAEEINNQIKHFRCPDEGTV